MTVRFPLQYRYVALLWVGAIAALIHATAVEAAGSTDKLRSLANDTAAQLELAYRQHPVERQLRQQQFAAVVKSWRVADRSETNNERLANWLHAAILSSMPGSQDPLPPAPSFGAIDRAEPQSQTKAHEAPIVSHASDN